MWAIQRSKKPAAGWAEPVAERLQPLGLAGGEAVGQLGEAMPCRGLPLGPLVAVDPHLGRVGEVGAQLDEPRAELGIQT